MAESALFRHRARRHAACLAAVLAGGWILVAAAQPKPDGDSPPPEPRGRVVHEARSRWNRILVVDQGELRSLRFGDAAGDTQSTVSLRDPRLVPMEYIRHAASAAGLAAERRRLLVIGLGGGTYPMLFRRAYPAMFIDVVELDPVVRRVARRYFGFVEDAKLRVHTADGAAFMRKTRGRWDVVLLDAYGTSGIPDALATVAFFADVARSLTPGGVAVANVACMDADAERAVIARFARAFAHCVLQRTPTSDNVIAVAGAALPKDIAGVLRSLDGEGRLPFPVASMADAYRPCAE